MASQQDPKIPCHISDKFGQYEDPDEIRKSVCRDLETAEHTDKKYYCLLHFPSKEKGVAKFDGIFESRLNEVKDKAAEIEKMPEDERERARNKIYYDFRCVWFPTDVNLHGYKFLADANFREAAFSGDADFDEAEFSGAAKFTSAKFSGDANFGAKFSGDVNFISAAFSGFADFSTAEFFGNVNFTQAAFSEWANFSTAFSGSANFSKAEFFGEANFISAEFSGEANFTSAKFSGDAGFDSAKFSGTAFFRDAEFSGTALFGEAAEFSDDAFFSNAAFSQDAYFGAAEFSEDANFSGASFSKSGDFKKTVFFPPASFPDAVFAETAEIFFEQTKFYEAVNLRGAVFEGFVSFADLGNRKAVLDLQNARLKKPERISFHTVRLRPGWFVNTDPRKMVFTNCHWDDKKKKTFQEFFRWKNIKKNKFWEFFKWKNIKGKTRWELLKRWWPKNEYIETELNALAEREIPEGNRLLGIACRHLAVNAEENNRYEEAMRFRYMSMDSHRRADWWRRFLPVSLHWWYWASSGYGERALRATAMLLLVWVIPFLFYLSPWAVFANESNPPSAERTVSTGKPGLEATDAAFYSLYVMAFQKPEPKPANESPFTKIVVTAQTILGPVQAALLLLAIRRKFMR